MENWGAILLMLGTSLQACDHIVYGVKNRKKVTWPYIFDGIVWVMLAAGATLISMSVAELRGWWIPVGIAILSLTVAGVYRLRSDA